MTPEDLTPFRLDLVLIRETAERIIHDFEVFGIQLVFSGDEQKAYDELMDQLIPEMDRLCRSDRPKLMNILYRIDIDEHKLSSTMQENPAIPLPEIIARLVIEREMQKVITRRYFKGKE